MAQHARSVQIPKVDQQRAHNALLRMIIIDGHPFSFVEQSAFVEFVESLAGPCFQVPSAEVISRDCVQLFMDEKSKLKSFINMEKPTVCLTLDTWTTNESEIYLCITAHFIDDNWELHKQILNFTPICSYEGEEIGRAVEKCLHDWEINDVMTISAGNASLDIDAAVTYLRGKLPNTVLDGKFLRLGCIVDFINTLVKDLLNEHDELIERVRGAVSFVGLSEARIKMFKECAKESGIEYESFLSLDCPTRWNSTFRMLKTSEKFEKIFSVFETEEPEFMNYMEDTGGVLVLDDWQIVRKLLTFLSSFHKLYEHIFGLNVTSNDFFVQITTIECLLRKWEKSDDTGTRIIALKMRESFTKYWGGYENINMLVYVADVLDPRRKLAYVKHFFEELTVGGDEDSQTGDCLLKKMVELVRSTTFDLFNEYKGKVGTQSETLKSDDYMECNSFVREYLEWLKTCSPGEGDNVESETELERYLNEYHQRKVDGFEILNSWKISTRFRFLSKMAKDVLAIPMSAVAPESAFTIGGKFLDDFKSSLSPEIVEALVCAQDWIRKSRKPLESEEDLMKLDDYLEDFDEMENSSSESEYSSGESE